MQLLREVKGNVLKCDGSGLVPLSPSLLEHPFLSVHSSTSKDPWLWSNTDIKCLFFKALTFCQSLYSFRTIKQTELVKFYCKIRASSGLDRQQEVEVLTSFWRRLQSLLSTKEAKATAMLSSRTLRVWKCTYSLCVCVLHSRGKPEPRPALNRAKMTPIIHAVTATTIVWALSWRRRAPSAKEIGPDLVKESKNNISILFQFWDLKS